MIGLNIILNNIKLCIREKSSKSIGSDFPAIEGGLKVISKTMRHLPRQTMHCLIYI